MRVVSVLTFVVTGLAVSALPAQRRPNIVFVFSDDHAVQSIGAYGSRVNRTPRIDQLAAEGAILLPGWRILLPGWRIRLRMAPKAQSCSRGGE